MTFKVPQNGLVQGEGAEPNNPRSRLAHKWPIPVGSLVASAVVGTILTLANHGDRLFTGQLELSLAWMVPLNYVISLGMVVASSRLTNPDGERPSPSDAASAHGDGRLGR